MIEKIIPSKIDFKYDLKKKSNFLSECIKNKNILVVGGAGTIGSNYIKEILKYKPSLITVVDINENALTELTRDLRSSKLLDYKPRYLTYPINLLSDLFDKVFLNNNYNIVANFSALKHVRSEKDIFSSEAIIRNNIFGAIKLLELCEKRRPNFFFSVSTVKAANPVNIMGASKLLMEKLIISKKNKIRVSTARFANVAFSNGSLLQGFNYRMKKKQPLSCPSDIKRFFVTPKQSGEICLLSTFLGESGNIFFPKLDFNKDQIYFKDIALNYLKYYGYKPYLAKSEEDAKNFEIVNKFYPILFLKSDTTGEKKFEEFYDESDLYILNKFHSLGFIIDNENNLNFENVKNDFNEIFLKKNINKSDIISVFEKYIELNHEEIGKSLDEKM